MSTPKDNQTILKNDEQSLFSLNALELGFAVLGGIATWFWLSNTLHSTLPFPCDSSVNGISIECGWTKEQAWEALGRPLFSTYVIPLVLFLAISSIFLVRSIRKEVRHFSTIANLAFSYPIFSFLGFFILSVFSLPCLPIGLVLAIIAAINSGKTKNYKMDWISLPFNLAWLVIFGLFISQFLDTYGD
jgi:hypothetical protein